MRPERYETNVFVEVEQFERVGGFFDQLVAVKTEGTAPLNAICDLSPENELFCFRSVLNGLHLSARKTQNRVQRGRIA